MYNVCRNWSTNGSILCILYARVTNIRVTAGKLCSHILFSVWRVMERRRDYSAELWQKRGAFVLCNSSFSMHTCYQYCTALSQILPGAVISILHATAASSIFSLLAPNTICDKVINVVDSGTKPLPGHKAPLLMYRLPGEKVVALSQLRMIKKLIF